MARKFKLNKLRELHSAIGALIAESDAGCAQAADDEDDSDAPTGDDSTAQAKLAAGHAQDDLPMHLAFKGFDRVGHKYSGPQK
jgi:hypothetical protein